jgi:hypothetical protein
LPVSLHWGDWISGGGEVAGKSVQWGTFRQEIGVHSRETWW